MKILVAKLYIVSAKIFLAKYLKTKDQPIYLSGKALTILICCEPHRFLKILSLQEM